MYYGAIHHEIAHIITISKSINLNFRKIERAVLIINIYVYIYIYIYTTGGS